MRKSQIGHFRDMTWLDSASATFSAPVFISNIVSQYKTNPRVAIEMLIEHYPELTIEEAHRIVNGDYEVDNETVVVKRTDTKEIT